jgi:RNA polymerase I-specific transcription initiation factor RRN6
MSFADCQNPRLETVNLTPFLDDIDENVREFELFKAEIDQTKDKYGENLIHYLPLKIGRETAEKSSGLGDSCQEIDVLQLYDRLIHDWLSVLPHDIPGRTRIFKEKMIRNITAELCLARILSARPLTSATDGSGENNEIISNARDFPDFPGEIARIQRTSSDAQSAPHKTDDELAVASANLTLSAGQRTAVTIPALIRLNSLTISDDHSSLPKCVDDILSHWVPGGDPGVYDWQKLVREEEMERLKIEHKQAIPKHIMRRRSQSNLAAEEPALARSSPIVPIIQYSGSQPQGEHLRAKLRSSQLTEENLPMTQIERGVFGSRESVKKIGAKIRKKKRAAGF